MLPSYTLMQSCKTGKKCSLFFFFFLKNLLCIPLWIKAEERDRGLMVTAATSLWLIFSRHLCEMQVWLWHADALFLFSHEDETRRDSGFAGACWSCLSSLLASSSAFILTTFFSLFSIFVLAFMHPPFFICPSWCVWRTSVPLRLVVLSPAFMVSVAVFSHEFDKNGTSTPESSIIPLSKRNTI